MSIRNGLLALLADGPEYGFALKKQFEERTAELWPLNIGQVYTTLGRLVRDGMVEEVVGPVGSDTTESGDSTELSAGGSSDASQREYRLTGPGRDELRAWINEPRPRDVPDRDELVIKIALAEHLGDVDLLGVVDAQRAVSLEALQRLTRAKASIDPDDLGQVLAMDAVVLQVEAELRWLDLVEARVMASKRHRQNSNRNVNSHTAHTRSTSRGGA